MSFSTRFASFALAIIACVLLVGAWLWPQPFFRAWWFALMFWTQLSIGALIILLLQHLTGGAWGRAAMPLLRSASSALFLLLPLFIPALFFLPDIFSWTQITPGISAAVLVNKQAWLNVPAFILRTCVYLGLFGILVAARRRAVFAELSGPALVLTIVLISFCSADWMMSLQPSFYSSLYPFLYFSGAMVSTFSLVAGSAAWLQLRGDTPREPEFLLPYGKLLFASVLFWGYIVFCQFIIVWTGNLPDEAEWYIVRSEPAWFWFTLVVLAGHFAIPFSLLLSQRIKKNPRRLLAISAALFFMHGLEVFWLMRPTPGEGFQASFFDLLLPVVIGGGWCWFVFRSAEFRFPSPTEETHGALVTT